MKLANWIKLIDDIDNFKKKNEIVHMDKSKNNDIMKQNWTIWMKNHYMDDITLYKQK
jgi:hypothetical protein